MTYDEMREAVKEAKNTLTRADYFVGDMADLIAGRLRSGGVSWGTCEKLKRELKDFNIHTGVWKKK